MQGEKREITISTKAFNLMYGTQEVNGWEEVTTTLKDFNILWAEVRMEGNLFTNDELQEKITMLKEGYGNPKPKHLNFTVTEFGKLINITMETDEDDVPYDLNSDSGVFGYVWNVTDDWCSEYGYAFYENNQRVG